ncbi:MAG: hypothetical protein EOP82_13450 [Variovorax sp.]|nr:MAG: hypothetical protein EOP82_13450 [Variovorax sp.]
MPGASSKTSSAFFDRRVRFGAEELMRQIIEAQRRSSLHVAAAEGVELAPNPQFEEWGARDIPPAMKGHSSQTHLRPRKAAVEGRRADE